MRPNTYPAEIASFGCFNDFDRMAETAARLNQRGENVYHTLNPIKAAVVEARGLGNLIIDGRVPTVKDDEIEERLGFIIDTDFTINGQKEKGKAATDAEHQAVGEETRNLRDWLTSLELPLPFELNSGNGRGLIYQTALPNDEAAKELLRRVLKALADKFDNQIMLIDRSMSKACQLIRMPGTLNQKAIAPIAWPRSRRPQQPVR